MIIKLFSLFVCAILIFVIYKSILNRFSKTNWFSNLKQGDKILVRIFSDSCECLKEATVVNSPTNSYIEAKVDDVNKCLDCAKIKALTKSGMNESSCWSHITLFHKKNVFKK